MKILLIWPNKDQFGFKPMSLSILSALIKKEGHEVSLFDTTYIDFGFKDNTEVRSKLKIFKPVDFTGFDLNKKKLDLKEELFKKLNDFKPDIVGISALSDEIYISYELSNYVKEWNNKTWVVWGNKAATMAFDKILECKSIDYICRGEGIEFIKEFMDCIVNKKNLSNINNLVYKNKDGEIIKNSLRPYFQDIDSLPYFDWSIFDERHFLKPYDGKVYRGGDHMIYWGCPNRCTYCINDSYRKIYGKNSGRFLRSYSIDRIIDELKYLVKKWNLNFFKFHDEDFCLKPMDYFSELAEKYQNQIGVPFTIMANAKNINKEKVNLLKKMNCVSVTIGIETGNNKLRKEILKRNETKDEIIKATKLMNEADIRTSAFNMLAIPFENRDSIMETIELNKIAEVRYPNVGFFFPLEGTELRDISIKNGFFKEDSNAVFQNDRPTLKFKEISEEELIALREHFILYIKLPYEFYKFIKRSEQKDEIGINLTKKLYEIYEKSVFQNDGFWDDNCFSKKYIEDLERILNNN